MSWTTLCSFLCCQGCDVLCLWIPGGLSQNFLVLTPRFQLFGYIECTFPALAATPLVVDVIKS